MLEYDRIGVSEGIDVNEINLSKECDICHYSYYDANKMDNVPLQLKIKIYYEIHDNTIYIENNDKGFFQTIRETWNKITKLLL